MMIEVTAEQYLAMYRDMLRVRLFEFALEREFQRGKVPGMLHTGVGQEATLTAVAYALRPEDGIFPGHRAEACLNDVHTPALRPDSLLEAHDPASD
jgi:TPP-dependent pyruvate/acetoin dehydrogenase alpha subunit